MHFFCISTFQFKNRKGDDRGVPVKASAENGAIQPGDLLVSSDTPGYAMKAGENPPQGTVIGKALAALEEGLGVIQVLVTLQ